MKTSQDQLQRMEALVRKLAALSSLQYNPAHADEARAIVAELDGPQTDEEWAVAIAKDAQVYPNNLHITLISRGIAKGRELERLDRGDLVVGNISMSLDAKKLLNFKQDIMAAVDKVFDGE